jgi:hypothetical protein
MIECRCALAELNDETNKADLSPSLSLSLSLPKYTRKEERTKCIEIYSYTLRLERKRERK